MADDLYLDNLINQGTDNNGDVEVEMALLSLCMRKDTAVVRAENTITEEDFSDQRNRTIFRVISDMFLDNAKIDRITVFAELERRGLADKAGGQRYVYRVGDQTAVQSAIDSYIAAIRERSDKNKILKAVDDVKKKALSGEARSSEIADYAIKVISDLRGVSDTKGFEGMPEILKLTMNDIYSELKDDNAGGKVKLGFPRLDSMLGGLRPGSLNILAARPSMGKSALAINMAANVAANQYPVAIFSLEMSKQEIATRLMSSSMNKPVSEIIYSHKMSDSDRKQIDRALQILSDFPIYIDDNSDTNPITMKTKLTQLFADEKKRPRLVIIDYLQLMTMPAGSGGKSRNEEVTAISRSLKLLAKDFNIPFIALSQLSRGAAQRDDHTPQLSDLRDSGAIEQDADTVMFIDRPDYYKKKDEEAPSDDDNAQQTVNFKDGNEVKPAFIYLSKNRHGKTGRDSVCWIPKKTMFIEYNERNPEDDGGSAYTRTVDSDTASQNYNFDSVTMDEAPIPEPPMPGNDDVPPETVEGGDDFFAQTNDDFPSGF